MLATLVIGLREGLEAALIVSIVAAFLKKNGRSDALRLVWIGVAIAVGICLAGGILLQRYEASLPQRQQEMLECLVAVAAVIMVSYMILWMKSHSRGLKGALESAAGGALATGSGMALVVMAFLAVFREGFETAVFLLAAFQSSVSPTTAALGAVLGIAIAVALGILLYRGAVRLDLSRFFRATGVVLVFVAAGLVMSALRSAHEAGWITVGQQPAVNLTWLAEPGTIQSSLLTSVLGIRADPTVIEVTAWLLYLVPMLVVVLWPPRHPLSRLAAGRLLTGSGVAALVVGGALIITAPDAPAAVSGPQTLAVASTVAAGGTTSAPVRGDGTVSVTLVARPGEPDSAAASGTAGQATIVTTIGGTSQTITTPLTVSGHADVNGLTAVTYQGAPTATAVDAAAAGLPSTVTGADLAAGGRLPIGLRAGDASLAMPASYTDTTRATLDVDPVTGAVLDVRLEVSRTVTVTTPRATTVSGGSIGQAVVAATPSAVAGQTAAVRSAADAAVAHATRGQALPALFAVFALVMFGFGVPKLFHRKESSATPTASRTAAAAAAPRSAVAAPTTLAPVAEGPAANSARP